MNTKLFIDRDFIYQNILFQYQYQDQEVEFHVQILIRYIQTNQQIILVRDQFLAYL